MLALAELKRWQSFYLFDAQDGQHFNSTFAWFCRENKIFGKKGQTMASILTLQHIYIYTHSARERERERVTILIRQHLRL